LWYGLQVFLFWLDSSEVIWNVVRNNSAFRIHRQIATFSSEPRNLTGRNTYRYSGFVNKKNFGLERNAEGAVVLSVQKQKFANKPSKFVSNVTLVPKGAKRVNFRKVASSIVNHVCGKHYRPDLKKAALARWTKLNDSAKRTVQRQAAAARKEAKAKK